MVLGSKALDERLVETVLGFLKELTYSGVRLTLCLSRLSASVSPPLKYKFSFVCSKKPSSENFVFNDEME